MERGWEPALPPPFLLRFHSLKMKESQMARPKSPRLIMGSSATLTDAGYRLPPLHGPPG